MEDEQEGLDMTRVRDSDRGTFAIRTECSTYLLDLDQRRLKRLPGTTNPPSPRPDGITAFLSPLPRDNEWVALEELLTCRIGDPMTALTERVPGFSVVYRKTTHVKEIRRVRGRE